jgi:hypothetical protein
LIPTIIAVPSRELFKSRLNSIPVSYQKRTNPQFRNAALNLLQIITLIRRTLSIGRIHHDPKIISELSLFVAISQPAHHPEAGEETAKIRLHPPPPTLWKSFFGPFIACNLYGINSLHFLPVDESVTANP